MRAALVVVALAVLIALYLRRPAPPREAAVRAELVREAAARRASSRARRPDAAVARTSAPETHALALGWGRGVNQVGKRKDPESAGEGPMSFVVGRDGTVYILDQVNERILRRTKDGRWLAPIPLSRGSAQDLRVDAHGTVSVLDRLGDRTLTRYDANGTATTPVPLASLGVADPGGATGLFDDEQGNLYVEESLRGQGKRIVHGADGTTVLAGRPSRDGRELVQAQILSRTAGTFVVRGLDLAGTLQWESPLDVPPSVLMIVLCETDADGDVFVGVVHAQSTATHDLTGETLDLFHLRADGTPVGHLSVAHPPSMLEQFRELSVGDDGTVYWMHPAADGSGMVVDALSV